MTSIYTEASRVGVHSLGAIRRVGDRYCGAGCGRGCTIDEYREALRDAEELACVLGAPWLPNVWENLGWHSQAILPGSPFSVSQSRFSGRYTCYGWGTAYCGTTPARAVKALREALNEELIELTDLLGRLS